MKPHAESDRLSSGTLAPRILFFSQRYPPAFGGGSLYLKRIRDGITEAGFASIVLTGDRGIEGGAGPGVYRLPPRSGGSLPGIQLYLFALMAAPALIALRHRYDLIHTMGNCHFVYVGILVGRALGKRVIVSSVQNRCDDPIAISRQRFGRLKNGIFRRADRWVCCSGLQVEAYREAGYPESRVLFIPSAVDSNRFGPCDDPAERAGLREKLGLPRQGPVFLSVGAIDARKGIDLLAEGWAKFRGRVKHGTLVLVGPDRRDDPGSLVDPRFVASIREALRRSDVADSVIFTGRVDNVQDYMRAADVFVLMSRGEGFPNALLEAMATSLPFVVWDLPDYAGYELEDGLQGFLVPRFDTTLLSEQLARLAASAEIRTAMGRHGRALSTRYTVARAVGEHISLYRDATPPR